jgi:hypothetical protein
VEGTTKKERTEQMTKNFRNFAVAMAMVFVGIMGCCGDDDTVNYRQEHVCYDGYACPYDCMCTGNNCTKDIEIENATPFSVSGTFKVDSPNPATLSFNDSDGIRVSDGTDASITIDGDPVGNFIFDGILTFQMNFDNSITFMQFCS